MNGKIEIKYLPEEGCVFRLCIVCESFVCMDISDTRCPLCNHEGGWNND